MYHVYSWTPFAESQSESFMAAYDLWVIECSKKDHAIISEDCDQGQSIVASFDVLPTVTSQS